VAGPVAFVLGGGGLLGAHEVGMLRALLEAGIVPDLVVGTSVGAINGVVVAEDPTTGAVQRLADLWLDLDSSDLFGGSVFGRLTTLARTRTSLHTEEPLRDALNSHLTARTFEELHVPFQCVAANVERAAEHWFSAARWSRRARVLRGARPAPAGPSSTGRPTWTAGWCTASRSAARWRSARPRSTSCRSGGSSSRSRRRSGRGRWGWFAFEVARRHRFAADMASLPSGVTAHLLPTGAPERAGRPAQPAALPGPVRIARRIDSAYAATTAYLAR
jgi:NTE family protein